MYVVQLPMVPLGTNDTKNFKLHLIFVANGKKLPVIKNWKEGSLVPRQRDWRKINEPQHRLRGWYIMMFGIFQRNYFPIAIRLVWATNRGCVWSSEGDMKRKGSRARRRCWRPVPSSKILDEDEGWTDGWTNRRLPGSEAVRRRFVQAALPSTPTIASATSTTATTNARILLLPLAPNLHGVRWDAGVRRTPSWRAPFFHPNPCVVFLSLLYPSFSISSFHIFFPLLCQAFWSTYVRAKRQNAVLPRAISSHFIWDSGAQHTGSKIPSTESNLARFRLSPFILPTVLQHLLSQLDQSVLWRRSQKMQYTVPVRISRYWLVITGAVMVIMNI